MRIVIKIKFPKQSKPDAYIVNVEERIGDLLDHLVKATGLSTQDQQTGKQLHYWFEAQGKVLENDKCLADFGIGNSSALSLCCGSSQPEKRDPGLYRYEGAFVKK